MKVQIKSVSASKKQVSNATILFGKKGESYLATLEGVVKSKSVTHALIDNLLEWLRTADEEAVQEFASKAAGAKTLEGVKEIASAKSILVALKALDTLKFAQPSTVAGVKRVAPKIVASKLSGGSNNELPIRGPLYVEEMGWLSMDSNSVLYLTDPDTKQAFNQLKKIGVGLEYATKQNNNDPLTKVRIHGTKANLTKALVTVWDYPREDVNGLTFVPVTSGEGISDNANAEDLTNVHASAKKIAVRGPFYLDEPSTFAIDKNTKVLTTTTAGSLEALKAVEKLGIGIEYLPKGASRAFPLVPVRLHGTKEALVKLMNTTWGYDALSKFYPSRIKAYIPGNPSNKEGVAIEKVVKRRS